MHGIALADTPLFVFDLTSLMTYASQMFTSLMPIVGLVGGLSLGIGLVMFVLHEVRNLFHG